MGSWHLVKRHKTQQKTEIVFTFRRCSFQMHKRTRCESGRLSMDAHEHASGVRFRCRSIGDRPIGPTTDRYGFPLVFVFGCGCLAMRSFVIRGRTRRSSYSHRHRHTREMQTCNSITFVHRWPGWLDSYYTLIVPLKCHIFIILNVLLRLTWIALGTCKA